MLGFSTVVRSVFGTTIWTFYFLYPLFCSKLILPRDYPISKTSSSRVSESKLKYLKYLASYFLSLSLFPYIWFPFTFLPFSFQYLYSPLPLPFLHPFLLIRSWGFNFLKGWTLISLTIFPILTNHTPDSCEIPNIQNIIDILMLLYTI